jgi:hypothetical protein
MAINIEDINPFHERPHVPVAKYFKIVDDSVEEIRIMFAIAEMNIQVGGGRSTVYTLPLDHPPVNTPEELLLAVALSGKVIEPRHSNLTVGVANQRINQLPKSIHQYPKNT